MPDNKDSFSSLNTAFNSTFKPNRLTLGLIVPLESYPSGPVPSMYRHLERVKKAEQLGFSAVWLRDVPFNVPSFGDAGQIFDPFVYLGMLTAETSTIALGIASLILPLRHPAQIAKAAATVDVLSEGRLLLGVASGDRPQEYPALNKDFATRSESFRDCFNYIMEMWQSYPNFSNNFGNPNGGMDMLPKPVSGEIPLLITGGSQQDPEWVAQNGHGWITYPRGISQQKQVIDLWRSRVKQYTQQSKPVVQSLYIDLSDEAQSGPQPIHLGFRSGVNYLRDYLKSLEEIGVNHVAINLRLNQLNIERTMNRLAEEVLIDFTDN